MAFYNYPQFGQSFAAYPAQMPASAPVSAFPPQQGNTPSSGYVCRPVASRAEVEAFQIPFDGSTTYFVDTSTGKIYAKTFDFNTGSAPIVTYVREQEVKVQYATIDDLNALREELLSKRKVVKKNDPDE